LKWNGLEAALSFADKGKLNCDLLFRDSSCSKFFVSTKHCARQNNFAITDDATLEIHAKGSSEGPIRQSLADDSFGDFNALCSMSVLIGIGYESRL